MLHPQLSQVTFLSSSGMSRHVLALQNSHKFFRHQSIFTPDIDDQGMCLLIGKPHCGADQKLPNFQSRHKFDLVWVLSKKTSSQYEPSTASPSSLQQTPLAYCAIWKQDQPFSHAARGTFAQVRGKPCHCRCKLVTPNQAHSLSLGLPSFS